MSTPFLQSQQPLLVFIPRYLRLTVLLSLLVGLVMALAVSVLFFKMQPVIPLFYSLPRDTEILVPKQWMFLFPCLSVLITLVHVGILTSSRYNEVLLLKLFAWTTVGIQVMLFLAIARIILITI